METSHKTQNTAAVAMSRPSHTIPESPDPVGTSFGHGQQSIGLESFGHPLPDFCGSKQNRYYHRCIVMRSCAVGSQSFSWHKLAVLSIVIAGCTTCPGPCEIVAKNLLSSHFSSEPAKD